jgi:hypothetical protein
MAGSIYYQHKKGTQCRDTRHRSCAGTWRGEIRDGDYRRRVTGSTKREIEDRFEDIERELGLGVKASATYTVAQAVRDWFDSRGNLAPKTIKTKQELLSPVLAEIGAVVLRDLEADDVIKALKATTATRSSRTVRDSRSARWCQL